MYNLFLAIMNGSSSMSLESDISSAISDDMHSTISQETTIIREPRDESIKNGESASRNHSRALSVAQNIHVQRYDKFQSAEVKDVLLCFLFIVKYLGEEQLITWWQQCAEPDVVNFFSVLEMSLFYFKYVGKRNVIVNKVPVPSDGKPKPAKAHTLPARMNPSDFNHDNNTATLVIHTVNRENLVDTRKYASI